MRKIIQGFVNGEKKPLVDLGLEQQKIIRVWTVLDKSLLNESDLENVTLRHLHNVFIEDKIHDWDCRNGIFHFYGHSGDKGEIHDLLIETE